MWKITIVIILFFFFLLSLVCVHIRGLLSLQLLIATPIVLYCRLSLSLQMSTGVFGRDLCLASDQGRL